MENGLSSAVAINDLSSDHLPVKIVINSNLDFIPRVYYDYKRAKWSRYSAFIKNNLPDHNINITDVEEIDTLINGFNETVLSAIEYSVPKKRIMPSSQAFPFHIRRLIQARNRHRRNWKRYRSVIDHIRTNEYNYQIKEAIKDHKNKTWNRKLASLEKGSSPFWNISKILKKKSTNIPILQYNNEKFYTQQDKCEILAQIFSFNHEISSNLSNSLTISDVNNTIDHFNATNTNNDNQFNVSIDLISSLLQQLRPKKSPGDDGITNKCLKFLPRKGIKFITEIINWCLRLHYFPKVWKHSKVVPIRKPNKSADCPLSYRPINLLSSLSKVLEKVIKEKIISFIDAKNILPTQQFGFRREHNTTQPLIRLRNIINKNFAEGKSTGMVLLDVKSAFDSVWHNGLIYKMIKYEFPPVLIKMVSSFLTDRSFSVYIGTTHSLEKEVLAGCPQGSCLSPILYNIYTADFPALEGSITSIFADDTAIISSAIQATDVLNNLQTSLTAINEYFTRWKIVVNPQKTQAIYFTRRIKQCYLPQSNITFNNASIPWVDKAKYLGVILDPKLKFKYHIPYIVDKVNKLTRLLYSLINRNSKLNIQNKNLIFKSIFQSIMFYAAPVWSTTADCHIKKLQITQNKLLKMMYKLPWHYSTQRLHTLANVELVKNRIGKLITNFYSKCLHSEFAHINELVSS